MFSKLLAEFIGTFWLVPGGCGSAVLAARFPELGIGLTGVSLAFGLTVLTAAYALGPISGGHSNPAVSVGLWAGGRFPMRHLAPYIVSQVAGAVLAVAQLWLFWLAPLLGGTLAGVLYRSLLQREPAGPAVSGQPQPGMGLGAH